MTNQNLKIIENEEDVKRMHIWVIKELYLNPPVFFKDFFEIWNTIKSHGFTSILTVLDEKLMNLGYSRILCSSIKIGDNFILNLKVRENFSKEGFSKERLFEEALRVPYTYKGKIIILSGKIWLYDNTVRALYQSSNGTISLEPCEAEIPEYLKR